MRVKSVGRKDVSQPIGLSDVWHPALTTAAEQGEEHLQAALEARQEVHDGLTWVVRRLASCPHSRPPKADSDEEAAGAAAEVPASPFPPRSRFGIVPYAAWHGHHAVVAAYLYRVAADSNVDHTALVPTEPHLQVRHEQLPSFVVQAQLRASVIHTVPASALQIAVWKRDTRMVKLLLEHGASDDLPFLLDMAPPRPGTLFATKAGEWSQEGHWCYPPAFRSAVREMLRMSHRHGSLRRQDGQQRLRWGLNTRELQDLLLPVLGRGSMTAWAKPDDQLPGDGDEEASEAAGSEDVQSGDED